jgi:hypothetical protein
MACRLAPRGEFRPLNISRSIWLSSMLLSAFGLVAAASVAPAHSYAAQSGPIKISIDTPTDGQSVKVGETIGFGGWAAVTGAGGSVDTVEVFIDGQPGEGGVSLGKATYGSARPDVAATLGNAALTNVGFELAWRVTGAAGNRPVYVYVHSPTHGWSYQDVMLTVEPGAASAGTASGSTGSATQGTGSGSPYSPTNGTGYRGQGTQYGPTNPGMGQPYGAGAGAYGQGMGYAGQGASYGQGTGYYGQAAGPYSQGAGYYGQGSYSGQSYGSGAGQSQWGGPFHAAAIRSIGNRSPGSPYGTSGQYGQTGYGGTSPFTPTGYGQGYGARSPYNTGYAGYQGYAGYRGYQGYTGP